jgi:hypothetical protein
MAVQVKLHAPDRAPSTDEWCRFLAGCPVRRTGRAIFLTTGRLTASQLRDVQEAGFVLIQGIDEINRFAAMHGLAPFEDLLPAGPGTIN